MKLTNISKPAWHRNGSGGEHFEVITFDMAEDSQPRKMVAIRFPDDDNKDDFNPPRIAVLDVAMLAQGIIEAGEGNAWRGDRFSDELASFFTINKKEVTA
jgi:hypothetical protein